MRPTPLPPPPPRTAGGSSLLLLHGHHHGVGGWGGGECWGKLHSGVLCFFSPSADTCGRSVHSFSFDWPLQSAGSPCRPSIFQQSGRGRSCFFKTSEGHECGLPHPVICRRGETARGSNDSPAPPCFLFFSSPIHAFSPPELFTPGALFSPQRHLSVLSVSSQFRVFPQQQG